MRNFLNAILAHIGSESLTDEEFETVPEDLDHGYNEDTYQALRSVIISRESVSTQAPKLKYYFKSKGVELAVDAAKISSSNIFVGGPLE